MARLKAPAGGVERRLGGGGGGDAAEAATMRTAPDDPFAITTIEKAVVYEARVERDAAGRIVRVLGGRDGAAAPLNDALALLDSDSDGEAPAAKQHGDGDEWGAAAGRDAGVTPVVRSLVDAARAAAPAKPRHASQREREWLARLVARHGDDTRAMARDARLNPMQQTAADIARRICKMERADAQRT